MGMLDSATKDAEMEQRLTIVTLGVADLKRSTEFYERLGWRRSMANDDGIVFFQTGGIALALFPRHDLAKDANVSPDGDGFSGMTLAYLAATNLSPIFFSQRFMRNP